MLSCRSQSLCALLSLSNLGDLLLSRFLLCRPGLFELPTPLLSPCLNLLDALSPSLLDLSDADFVVKGLDFLLVLLGHLSYLLLQDVFLLLEGLSSDCLLLIVGLEFAELLESLPLVVLHDGGLLFEDLSVFGDHGLDLLFGEFFEDLSLLEFQGQHFVRLSNCFLVVVPLFVS